MELLDRAFGQPERPPLERVRRFLDALTRDPLNGCRVGRAAVESSIECDELPAPVAAWLEYLEGRLRESFEDARAGGQIGAHVDPGDLALTVIAAVQGGYLLARAHADPVAVRRALAGVMALIDSSAP